MKIRNLYILAVGLYGLMTIAFSGCIENDIPYPRIQPNFTSIEAQGETKPALIDTLKRNVTLYLSDTVDIENVYITDYTLSEGASVVGEDIKSGLNLATPYPVMLKLYQEYQWTITAVQEIQRYFTIANQIGVSTIDVASRRVVAYVSDVVDIKSVEVLTMKLGSERSVVTPDLVGNKVDFSMPVEVEVSDYGRASTWTIYVTATESSVTTERVDAWSRVAWVYGVAEVGKINGVEYRELGASEWIAVPTDWITHDGGNFTARIIHLQPGTQYEARATTEGEAGVAISFTTGSEPQLVNPSLDDWWLDGKVWCPWARDDASYWDTGNKGATTLGQSNSVPSDDTPFGVGLSAKLETKFVGIASIGKLAAGNLFTGSYVKTDGTNGILAFGREFTQRPTKLKGYLKYNCAPISHSSSDFTHLKGRPDTAIVWVALADWTEPFEIRTNPANRQLFDENDDHVIAYGKVQYGESVPEYIPFEVELDYRTTQRIPRYIVVVASASKYGDFFTGGDGSLLYVDELQLEYDY